LIFALVLAISYAQTELVLTHPINGTEEVLYVAENSTKKSTFKKPLTWVILLSATIFGAIAAGYCLKCINSHVKKIPSDPQMINPSSIRSESLTFAKHKETTTSRESVRRRYHHDDSNCGSRKSLRESVFDSSRKSGATGASASSRRSARFKTPPEERPRSRYGGGRHFTPMEKNSIKQNVADSPKIQALSPKSNIQPLLYE